MTTFSLFSGIFSILGGRHKKFKKRTKFSRGVQNAISHDQKSKNPETSKTRCATSCIEKFYARKMKNLHVKTRFLPFLTIFDKFREGLFFQKAAGNPNAKNDLGNFSFQNLYRKKIKSYVCTIDFSKKQNALIEKFFKKSFLKKAIQVLNRIFLWAVRFSACFSLF